MIQDIEPFKFKNVYKEKEPVANDFIYMLRGNEILMKKSESGSYTLPLYSDFDEISTLVYLFEINSHSVFYCQDIEKFTVRWNVALLFDRFEFLFVRFPRWLQFVCVTAKHLVAWYQSNKYCGCCGNLTNYKNSERALYCSHCGNVIYPIISPVVIVGVIDKDKLLLTQYAHSDFKEHGLISGYVEIGETLEEAVRREVKEEVGLKVKNIRYFGSQPWGVNHILIAGFFADLDGENHICLDPKELSTGRWFDKKELPRELSDISITYEMIETFRNSK
ncbi:hypothetical protein B5F53_06180 [Blautia sp. An249]|uniref:NAD(+) diphosphatase n=1 Tax=Blautia sp. An249 TaxID=1965603 RepID=UPI000B3766C3|nr:NAD(+) diphosphatase [Blautia sp. An249]OUO79540.1 hypothetical protein B5F53_06180 [Blautia sp. An249]